MKRKYALKLGLMLCLISQVAIGQIPEGWVEQDGWLSGSFGPDTGNATVGPETFELTGGGPDIWATSDGGHFLLKEASGDGAIIVRCTDVGTGSNSWTKGGIMVRNTLEADSSHAHVVMTGGDGGGGIMQWRLSNGAGSGYPGATTPAVEVPKWLKLERVGNQFSGYFSDDGVEWTQTATTQAIDMQDPVYVGFAVSSHANGELRTFTFDSASSSSWVLFRAKELASGPVPEDGANDVVRDAMLSWAPGPYADQHHVYLGESFEDVNSATVPTVSDLDANSLDVGRLEFGKTYFWRVDEVNGSPDRTVFKGEVWSFEVEPYAIAIPGATIAVTASSVSNEFSTAEQAINGSGLDANDIHGMEAGTMWFTASVDLDPWIQFEFDEVKKLDMMKVWNANSAAESAIGWGVKDVITEVSVDGVTWEVLPEANQFSRGPGTRNYGQYDAIDLAGAAAKYVRVNIQSNWGGLIMSYGLSEVQFFETPVQARTPNPADGSVNVTPNAVITWRSGREAGQHDVYIDTDINAVAEGTAPSVTTQINSLDLTSLELELGQTYYWRVDEVNNTEIPSVWTGSVWSLNTLKALVVDDFEGYNNSSPDRPFQTWLDGFGYSADEFFAQGYAGNGTGCGIGHDIWSLSSPYFDGPIMETDRTVAGSSQSMPFYYSNTGGVASETQRTFAVPQDWTVGGVQLLSIAFFGETGNTGTLYTKINGVKVIYPLEPSHVAAQSWKTWNIDLSTLGIDLQSVTDLAIGMDGAGTSGMLLIDDIVLRQAPSGPAQTISLVNDFDSLEAGSSMHDVPGWEGWFGDAQWGAKVVDTVAYSGTNSLEIVGTRDDVVPNWPLVENGVYEATVMQYVPTGTDGLMHFGPLSSYGANWDDTAWLGTLLSNCTTGMVYVNELDAGTRTEAPLLRDQWVQLRIVMNFDANACDFYYGDTLLGSLECPSAMGFDIWPNDDVDVLYYDDFSFESQ